MNDYVGFLLRLRKYLRQIKNAEVRGLDGVLHIYVPGQPVGQRTFDPVTLTVFWEQGYYLPVLFYTEAFGLCIDPYTIELIVEASDGRPRLAKDGSLRQIRKHLEYFLGAKYGKTSTVQGVSQAL